MQCLIFFFFALHSFVSPARVRNGIDAITRPSGSIVNMLAFLLIVYFKVFAVFVVVVTRSTSSGAVAAAMYALVSQLSGKISELNRKYCQNALYIKEWSCLQDFVRDPCNEDDNGRGEPPNPGWPSKGEIEFHDVVFRYNPETAPDAIALRQLNLRVKAGTKLGVIGRRGSGKTTLVNILLSLGNLTRGSVIVDGVDISGVKRRILRQKIGLVPQTPVIFEGSIRDNIVPLIPGSTTQRTDGGPADAAAAATAYDDHAYDDDATATAAALRGDDMRLLRLLDKFHLGDFVRRQGGLDARITKSDMSAGEQQLLCAVRALVFEPPILVLDEATATLDHVSADDFQQKIYENFGGTVINIAHHMHFVENADQVICQFNSIIVIIM